MFFDRPNELKAYSSFNVFDLKRLDGYPELQDVFSSRDDELHHLKHSVHRSGTAKVSLN
jgi:hypothetical protein